MATNLNYNVNVNATNGIQALNNLQNKVSGLNSAFAGLKNAIAGIAIGQVLTNLLSFADNIQDLSDATGIATKNILGFQKAVQAFGGSADGADKAILKLVTNIGAAADGSAEMQAAFGKVGVTIKNLATMSEQDILKETIKGLERMTDKSEQAYLKQQLLGKEFRNVATSGLAEAYAKATSESEKYAASIKSAAETQQRLETAIGKVKMTLLDSIKPMIDFINSMDQSKLSSAIESFTKIATVMTVFYGFSKLVAIAEGLTIGLTGAAGAAALFGINLIKNFTLFGKALAAIAIVIEGFKLLFPDTAKSIGEAFGKATNAVKEFIGIKPTDNSQPIKDTTKATDENAEANARAAETKRRLKAAVDELKNSLAATLDNFIKFNQQNIDAINLQTDLIGLTQQDSEVRRANAEITRKAAEEIAKLQDQKSKLNEAQKQQGGAALIDAQIAKIKEQAEVDKVATEQAIKNLEAKRNAYEALKSIQDFTYKSEVEGVRKVQDVMDQIRLSSMSGIEKAYAEIDISARKSAESAIDAENSRRRAAQQTLLTTKEQDKYYEAAEKGNDKLKRAAEEQYNYSRKFSTGWNKALKEYVDNATNAARQAERIFSKAFQGLEDLIVDFVKTGKFEWRNFVNMMLEELLRSQIQQVFAGILGGMQGSMGGILGGGNNNQQSAGGGGVGGILGSMGGLLGGGSPGSSPNNPMYVIAVGGGLGGGIMGSNDPLGDFINTLPGMKEDKPSTSMWDKVAGVASSTWDSIKSGASAVWDTVSSTVGGIASTVGDWAGSAMDTVGSWFGSSGGGEDSGSWLGDIASSIGGMFDGWFANGGNIGAGKFGVVGENGPELVSGPATVTPMSGSTNVTYNINAVDAQSFKAMIAADPSFIYAVSMQGAKGMPSGR